MYKSGANMLVRDGTRAVMQQEAERDERTGHEKIVTEDWETWRWGASSAFLRRCLSKLADKRDNQDVKAKDECVKKDMIGKSRRLLALVHLH